LHFPYLVPQIECDKCDKKFYDDEAYECHKIAGHTSHAYCFECDQAFWTSAEKRAHNKVVHPVPLMRGHRMCEECGKTFDVRLERYVIISFQALKFSFVRIIIT
jgi:hypothetical protein